MFDRLHTKRCSPSEMARALSVAGVTLSAEDVAELCERYADSSNPGMVNFRGLCDDVDSVFVLKGLESDPKSPVETMRVPRSPELSSSVDNNERELAKGALMVVARHSRVNGVVVNDFFKDFDYNRCGAIPRDEFLRCLNQLDGSIEPLAAQALAKCYTQVNWRVLRNKARACTNHVCAARSTEWTRPLIFFSFFLCPPPRT